MSIPPCREQEINSERIGRSGLFNCFVARLPLSSGRIPRRVRGAATTTRADRVKRADLLTLDLRQNSSEIPPSCADRCRARFKSSVLWGISRDESQRKGRIRRRRWRRSERAGAHRSRFPGRNRAATGYSAPHIRHGRHGRSPSRRHAHPAGAGPSDRRFPGA